MEDFCFPHLSNKLTILLLFNFFVTGEKTRYIYIKTSQVPGKVIMSIIEHSSHWSLFHCIIGVLKEIDYIYAWPPKLKATIEIHEGGDYFRGKLTVSNTIRKGSWVPHSGSCTRKNHHEVKCLTHWEVSRDISTVEKSQHTMETSGIPLHWQFPPDWSCTGSALPMGGLHVSSSHWTQAWPQNLV